MMGKLPKSISDKFLYKNEPKLQNLDKKKTKKKKDLFFQIMSNFKINYYSWFSLVSLFNGVSTFVGYLMPKQSFQKNISGTV